MSRIGRQPILLPAGVEVALDGAVITVTGPKGTLTRSIPAAMTVETGEGSLLVTRPSDLKQHKQLHGLTRTLIANMVEGVTNGYRKSLEITGVGYRAQKIGEKLQLNLGYSHPVEIVPPDGISFVVDTPDQAGRPRHRQGARRPGCRPRPGHPEAGAVQGQGRPLRGRGDPPKGRQGRQDRRKEVTEGRPR